MTGRGSYRIRACRPGALEDRRELTSVMQRAGPEASQSLFTTLFTSPQATVVRSVLETTTEAAAMRSSESRAATAGQSMNLKD